MSAPHRILRFRTAGSDRVIGSEARVVLDLMVDEAATPVGHVVELAAGPGTPARWAYILHDGRATGLQSTFSRQHLESRILEHYFEELIADERHSA